MFSKLFQLFSLKRKFFSTEETETSVEENSSRPTKRVRIEEPSSNSEDCSPQISPVQEACTTDDDDEEEELEVCDEIIPRGTKGKEVERIADLEEEVREARAITARLREETRNYVESIDRAMNCVVCYDFIRNPQVLSECGHTVCYPCLRKWFTRNTEDLNAAAMVSTDEESDGGNDDSKQPGSSRATPPPRRRHRFHSAVNRKKVCPECSVVITRRPRPLFRLRLLAEIINGAESPVPSVIQPRLKLYKASKRRDPWHGIFHAPGHEQEGQPAPMPQGRNERGAGLDRFQWEFYMDQAREEGRRQMIQELRIERTEYNEERRRQPFSPLTDPSQDEPMGVVERRIRALPSRRPPPTPAPSSSSTRPVYIPAADFLSSHRPSPSAWRRLFEPSPSQSNEFVSGSDASPPQPSHSISLGPRPSEAGPSNSNLSPTYSPTSPTHQHSSAPAIFDSSRPIQRQLQRTPSPHRSEGDVDELAEGDQNGDEDPPLMQSTNSPPASQYHREYPVYVEDLVLEEDLPPQAMQVDMPTIVHLDEGQGLPVPPIQGAEESQYEREHGDEGGVDLE